MIFMGVKEKQMNKFTKLADWIVDNKWRYIFVQWILYTIAFMGVCTTTALMFVLIYKAIQ